MSRYALQGHDFGWVLHELYRGHQARRLDWPDQGQALVLERPVYRAAGQEYISLRHTDGAGVPWQPAQVDLLAVDWVEVKP